jgi:hypothetical protein
MGQPHSITDARPRATAANDAALVERIALILPHSDNSGEVLDAVVGIEEKLNFLQIHPSIVRPYLTALLREARARVASPEGADDLTPGDLLEGIARLQAFAAEGHPGADADELAEAAAGAAMAARLEALLSSDPPDGQRAIVSDVINDLANDIQVWHDHPALVRSYFTVAQGFEVYDEYAATLAEVLALIDAGETFEDYVEGNIERNDSLARWKAQREGRASQ